MAVGVWTPDNGLLAGSGAMLQGGGVAYVIANFRLYEPYVSIPVSLSELSTVTLRLLSQITVFAVEQSHFMFTVQRGVL